MPFHDDQPELEITALLPLYKKAHTPTHPRSEDYIVHIYLSDDLEHARIAILSIH